MRWAAAVLGLVLAAPAAAQQITLEPSAAVACLKPLAGQRGEPEYPFLAFKQGQKGRVQVMLSFTSADTRPAVKVLVQEGDDSFVAAVEAHVRKMRLPCHDGGATPVQLRFDFVFQADLEKVFSSAPEDGDAAACQAQAACIRHISGDKAPEYPTHALRMGAQGRILVRLRFDAHDQPPVAEILPMAGPDASRQARRVARMLADPIEDWVKGYRMPCLSGRPITVTMTFVFVIEGQGYGFKPGLTLMTLLPTVRNIRTQRLNFDFNQLGCPFDVALQYRRPHMLNWVTDIGVPNPARRPFLDWLRQSDLDLPEQSLESIYGDTARITVPCLKINLNPQE